MTTVLGLDIGGTKSDALLIDGDTVLARVRGASASVQAVGEAQAGRALDDLVLRLGRDAREVDVVVAGSAGLDTPAAEARLIGLLRQRFDRARVSAVHDSRLLLAAGRCRTGCAFIFGTGSCAWALAPDGRTARSGGWGWILGDESSGFGMVRAAVRRALSDAQAQHRPSELSVRLCAAVKVAEPNDLIDAFYSTAASGTWAAYLPAVVEAYRAAVSVVTQAVEHATAEIVRAPRQVGITGPVVLGGGVAMNLPEPTDLLVGRLRAAGLTDVRVLDRDPVWGAVDLATTDPG